MKQIDIILNFLKDRKIYLLSFLVCPILFILIGILSDHDTSLMLYAALLSYVFYLLFIGFDFYRYNKRLKCLYMTICSLDAGIEKLPNIYTKEDELYQDIIHSIHQKMIRIESNAYDYKKDLQDYYTLWVHQIKTPITALSLIIQNEMNKNMMQIELFKIEQYVQMALQYTRIDSMSSDMDLNPYDLDSLIRSCIKKYSKHFILSKIVMNYTPCNKTIITDDKWFSFALEQLLSNALKYTKENGTISIFLQDETLCIQDTGIGIDASDLPRIFEKGFTGMNGRTDKKASGLGLYMTKTILNKLGYTIYAKSKLEEGTCIFIDLHQNNTRKE